MNTDKYEEKKAIPELWSSESQYLPGCSQAM